MIRIARSGNDNNSLLQIPTQNNLRRCDLVNNASWLAKAGLGYIITLDKLINTTGSSELCFRPLSPKLEANLYIVWKKKSNIFKSGRVFLKRLQSEFTETP